jgi:hypothetical protein
VAFVLHPNDVDLVTDLTFVLIGCFSAALSRAWQLMRSTTLGTNKVPSTPALGDGTEHLGVTPPDQDKEATRAGPRQALPPRWTQMADGKVIAEQTRR